LTQEIQIRHIGSGHETKSFTFPGGELQVQIPGQPESLTGDIIVLGRLQSADAIIRLLLATEIVLRHHRSGQKRLVVPYFPYARQDRVMQSGDPALPG
jgi:ribose-phosphate pyrophosphokinase